MKCFHSTLILLYIEERRKIEERKKISRLDEIVDDNNESFVCFEPNKEIKGESAGTQHPGTSAPAQHPSSTFQCFSVLGASTYPLGFFGLTSTGKSTIISKLIGFELTETSAGETTKEIQPYNRQGYCLFDIPGRNDDISYFSMEYIAFWKGLTKRLVLITATIKEMTKVFHLLDTINLRYDIVVNKFDLVPVEERRKLKGKINQEIRDCELRGVDHIWYVSARNPKQFPHWFLMEDSLTYRPENVFDDYEAFDYIFYE